MVLSKKSRHLTSRFFSVLKSLTGRWNTYDLKRCKDSSIVPSTFHVPFLGTETKRKTVIKTKIFSIGRESLQVDYDLVTTSVHSRDL